MLKSRRSYVFFNIFFGPINISSNCIYHIHDSYILYFEKISGCKLLTYLSEHQSSLQLKPFVLLLYKLELKCDPDYDHFNMIPNENPLNSTQNKVISSI